MLFCNNVQIHTFNCVFKLENCSSKEWKGCNSIEGMNYLILFVETVFLYQFNSFLCITSKMIFFFWDYTCILSSADTLLPLILLCMGGGGVAENLLILFFTLITI